MRRTAIALLTILSPIVCLAADLTDPTEILNKANDATKQTKVVSYNATLKGTGANETKMPSVSGSVIMTRLKNNDPEKYLIKGKLQQPGSSDVHEYAAGTNGDKYFLIDMDGKKAYEDIDPQSMGKSGRALKGLFMRELAHDAAFDDELKGEKKELRGSAKVGDEDCYQIFVKYAGQPQEAVWYISKKDFLPRKREQAGTMQNGDKAGMEVAITELNTAPKIDDSTFKLTLPAGFTKVEDFAP
ncbi:MAG: hypothetical protein HY287_09885 [Planctomycetes bacterium]|nr:hypothetical protein [Planctomycetota bacterium]MBI3834624.1 hypothetical protein [Planctomycetota bacterium]